ncbi:TetR/AcrR family transcriptional regulator [Actinoplanes sp. ATCC 53533]|uniref:TetR/AcrR family transcriptional regulator n=1 Tax=Actinoplanes sp. ATCC 53533 TaxID=1288362 RepID=UPI001F3F8273|nr:TetR/AcrR family transcriptional regulator [Actinoplanes sp. ATCC 53533]
MSRRPHAYAKVLSAAAAVLIEHSAAAFTLDAVAARAQVSKGGLMYHFPSKEALLTALVARAVVAVDDALAAAASSVEPGAFTRAYLDITIPDEPSTGHRDGPGDIVAALAAAVAVDPRLLTPLREAYARWQDRLENDGLDPAAATTVRLAVDGWWLAVLLDLPPLDGDVHRRTRARLVALTEGETPPPDPATPDAVSVS